MDDMEDSNCVNGIEQEEDDDLDEMEEVILPSGEGDIMGGESDGDSGAEVSDEESTALSPLREDAAMVFSLHRDSVYSVSVDGSGSLACSGGKDDRGLVWKVADGSVLFHCNGHKDSVTCTGFSHDSKYVATADMGGLLQVWCPATGELVWSFEAGDIEWLKWHPHAHVLLVGGSDGSGWMWRIPSGECKTFQGESSRNSCAVLTRDGKRICCGYENGTVKVFDLKEGVAMVSLTGGHGHSSAVTCLDSHRDNTFLLTGSEDETAKLINSNNGKVLCKFAAGFPPQREGADVSCGVEAVCFSPALPVVLTGSLSGVLGIWDLPTQKLRLQCVHQSADLQYRPGVVKLCPSELSPVVYTGSLDGVVRGWDLRSGQVVREWHGHSNHILDMTLTRNESAILSASKDGTVRKFSIM